MLELLQVGVIPEMPLTAAAKVLAIKENLWLGGVSPGIATQLNQRRITSSPDSADALA
jgi:hypothetical protein